MTSAMRTIPFPDFEIFGCRIHCPTYRTDLAGREETIDKDDLLTIPLSLVFQHTYEFTPGYFVYRIGKFMIPDHILYRKIFKADYVILPDKRGRQFLLIISSLICASILGRLNARDKNFISKLHW